MVIMAADLQCLLPRFRFSYRSATLIVCCCNIVAATYLLQFFIGPLISNASSSPFSAEALRSSLTSSAAAHYTSEQLDRMKEAIRIWRAAEPVDLIKRVKEIQNESGGVYDVEETRLEKKPRTVGLAERLKEIHDSKSKSDQEALEEWRRKKLEEARRRSKAMKAKQEEYLT